MTFLDHPLTRTLDRYTIGGLVILLLMCSFSVPPVVAQENQAEREKKLAVMNFYQSSSDSSSNWLSPALADMLMHDLSVSKKFDLIDREHLIQILREQQIQEFGISTQSMARNVGKSAEATHAVYGVYRHRNETLRLNVFVVHVRTGQLEQHIQINGSMETMDDLGKLVDDLSLKVLQEFGTTPSQQQHTFIRNRPTHSLDAATFFYRGVRSQEHGNLGKSIYQYRTALDQDPEFVRASYRQALVYRYLGSNQHYEIQLRKVYREHENSQAVLEALDRYSQFLYNQERTAESVEILKKYRNHFEEVYPWLKKKQNWIDIRIARRQLELGNNMEAYNTFRRVLTVSRGYDWPVYIRRKLRERGEQDQLDNFPSQFVYRFRHWIRQNTPRGMSPYNSSDMPEIMQEAFHYTHYSYGLLNSDEKADVNSPPRTIQLRPGKTVYTEEMTSQKRFRDAVGLRWVMFVPKNTTLRAPDYTHTVDGEKLDVAAGYHYVFEAPSGFEVDRVFTRYRVNQDNPDKYYTNLEVHEYPWFLKQAQTRVKEPEFQSKIYNRYDILSEHETVETTSDGDRIVTRTVPLPSGTNIFSVRAVFNHRAMDPDWKVGVELVPEGQGEHEPTSTTGQLSYYINPSDAKAYLNEDLLTEDVYFGDIQLPAGNYDLSVNHDELGSIGRTLEVKPDRQSFHFGSYFADMDSMRRLSNRNVYHPFVLNRGEDELSLVTSEKLAGRWDLLLRNSTDGGNTWSKQTALPVNSLEDDRRPHLIQDHQGDWILAWVRESSSTGRAIYVSRSENGEQWTTPKEVASGAIFSLAMIETRPNRYRIFFVERGEDFETFTLKTTLSHDLSRWSESKRIREAKDGRKYSLSAIHNPEGGILLSYGYDGNYLYVHSRESGGSWSRPVQVNQNPKFPVKFARLFHGSEGQPMVSWKSTGPIMLARSEGSWDEWSEHLLAVPFNFGGTHFNQFVSVPGEGLLGFWSHPYKRGLWNARFDNLYFNRDNAVRGTTGNGPSIVWSTVFVIFLGGIGYVGYRYNQIWMPYLVKIPGYIWSFSLWKSRKLWGIGGVLAFLAVAIFLFPLNSSPNVEEYFSEDHEIAMTASRETIRDGKPERIERIEKETESGVPNSTDRRFLQVIMDFVEKIENGKLSALDFTWIKYRELKSGSQQFDSFSPYERYSGTLDRQPYPDYEILSTNSDNLTVEFKVSQRASENQSEDHAYRVKTNWITWKDRYFMMNGLIYYSEDGRIQMNSGGEKYHEDWERVDE